MAEELIINVSDFETRVALLDQGSACEVHLARANNYSLTGNIYLGRVERVIPGMQAAFVDVGLERPGFLHARDIDDLKLPVGEDKVEHRDIRDLLRTGQEIMVQVAKDPISTKGARLTAQLAIASRYLVLMPFTDHIGISQRIEDEAEKDRLRELVSSLREQQDVQVGFIVRTAGEGVAAGALEMDMRVLVRMWDKILKNRHAAGCPGSIYQEIPLHIRVVRDLAGPTLERIVIDHQPTFGRVRSFVEEFLPEFADRLEFYEEPRPLFERYGVEDELKRALGKTVELKCGGHLVIEQTEAMITIDVNTGKFLGGSNLEDTVFRANLEAAQMIPRQLRLRNLGGIVVIDFIDMIDEEHQRQVLRALEKASELDAARIRIEGFSSLGLVQLSRKRTRESLLQQLCEPCERCTGSGVVRTAATTCSEIFRAISQDSDLRCGALPKDAGEYLIRATDSVVDRLLDEDSESLAQLGRLIGRDIRIQIEPSYGPGQFDIVLVQGVRR
ncbi:MAG: Rne/Rng family ribonuclease [Pseudomonadales bacterium]